MGVMETFAQRAKQNPKTIIYPEGTNPTILKAVKTLSSEGLAKPVLLGKPEELINVAAELGIDLSDVPIVHPQTSPLMEQYVNLYCQEKDMPPGVGQRIMRQPLCFAAMMVKTGKADCMVAGIDHPTEEVILASELIIGLCPGISVISSFFIMDIPNFTGGENGLLIFADPAVNPDPDAEQLADIALATAQSAEEILGWEPRVAMLSFSTKGSASHPLVDKVINATELARQKAPHLLIEGEMQADAAIVEAVAQKKMGSESKVGGKANILIFPDLNAANISCKLVQRLAKAHSYGPFLQGFNLPVSDLSRGATVDDIVGASIILSARA
ncbi:MAG: phosphate acetyltransferase [Anaerolineales bacterium]|nr:phosphate acetyltransferase [Anaerolineales bacterium]